LWTHAGSDSVQASPPTLVNAIADALSPFGELMLSLSLTPIEVLADRGALARAPAKLVGARVL